VFAGVAFGTGSFAVLAAAGALERPAEAGPADRATSVALVERPACAAPPGGGAFADGVVQTFTVTVRPTAVIGVDARGRVLDAWTNTGCAPRPTDDLYVRGPDGTIHPGGGDLLEHRWTGDFRHPGAPVDQREAG
jgi:hypothetical protein